MSELAMKSGGTLVAFGDVVRQVRDRVDPGSSGLERYVAGEHMDTDDLQIRQWGLIGDGYLGPAFHMRFKPGHVLYGSRRTYLRKVALADFEGITANTTFVIESKDPSILLPELLPFIMQTEAFHEHSIKQSKGSVNPYINFSDLTWFEFFLPSIEEQKRIAQTLNAARNYQQKLYDALKSLRIVISATEVTLIAVPLGLKKSLDLKFARPTEGWIVCSGQDLLDKGYLLAIQDGNHGSQYPRASELGDEGIPYIAASDISDDGDINLSSCRRIRPESAAQLRIPPAKGGDVILTNNATVGRVTRLPAWPTEIVASTSTTYYRCNEALLDPDYLRSFMESAVFQFQLQTIMRQSTRNQVPITTQKGLLFAIPPFEAQGSLAAQRSRFLTARLALQEQGGRVLRMQQLLLESAIVQ